MPDPQEEHPTHVAEAIGGWEAICGGCEWRGKVRSNKADAEYDAHIHPHTGGGARTFDEIREEEDRKSLLGRVRLAMNQLRTDAQRRRN